jgi:alkylation response protein AidB-like acyl-CoA dehydrogenase
MTATNVDNQTQEPLPLRQPSFELPAQYRTSLELEEFLGDPYDPKNTLSFKRSVELDELEEYPQEAWESLNHWGLHLYYTPAAYGGKLRSYEEMYSLLRLVARRDLTVAITHCMNYVAASTVWVGGSEAQKVRLAEIIKNEDHLAIGFHEQAHGHDFLSCELKAAKVDGGYSLSGEKWVIGNPIRSKTILIYARTEPHGGARGFSLFLLEKDKLRQSSFSYIPKFKTHGVRGHEVAGIRFEDCLVPESTILGRGANGVDITFKSSQITRTVFTAMSVGAADTALRVTLDFALSKRLYGDTVFSIPHTQSLLVDSFLDLLICDCVGIAVSRLFHVAPGQINITSALAKYFIPTTTEKTIQTLSVVLGARHFLRQEHCWGVFQKILRDCVVVRVGHLSSVINLSHLSQQIQVLAEYRQKTNRTDNAELRSRLKSIFTLEEPVPDFDSKGLSLYNRGHEDVLQGLETSLSELNKLKQTSSVDPEVLEKLISLSASVIQVADAIDSILTDERNKKNPAFGRSPEIFELAHRYSILHAAAACLHMWIFNRTNLGDFFARGEWVVLCLDRLMRVFQPNRALLPRPYVESMAHELLKRFTERRLFSIIELQLAQTETSPVEVMQHE